MLTVYFFSLETDRTATTVTFVPAAEIVMILGGMEYHLITLADYTSPEVLRLCHVIDVAA